jgi:hypothetical protein
MDLFGTKFTLALGAWKLRVVLMIEDDDQAYAPARSRAVPHHYHDRSRISQMR